MVGVEPSMAEEVQVGGVPAPFDVRTCVAKPAAPFNWKLPLTFTTLESDPRFRMTGEARSLTSMPLRKFCFAEQVDSVAMRGNNAVACASVKPVVDVAKSDALNIGL